MTAHVAEVAGSLVPGVLERILAETRLTATYANGAVIIRGRSAPAELAAGEIASADIIVTGTHIRHSQPNSPVITATSEELERTGRTSFGEYLRDLPQNFGGVRSEKRRVGKECVRRCRSR